MTKIKDIISFSFKDELVRIHTETARQASQRLILHHGSPGMPLWQQHLSADSHFCHAVVANGYLTREQMNRAASRYRLGMARDGGVIFWQIDQCSHVYDGKIMYYRDDCHRDHGHVPTWVSAELKRFYLDDDFPPAYMPNFGHCLFGTHLLKTDGGDVAVVEAEKTAVIMSERKPGFIWMATGGLEALNPALLFPLRNRRIILFPDTDETGDTYARWYAVAKSAEKLLGHPVRVSPILEQDATADQKRRKIDLVEFLQEC